MLYESELKVLEVLWAEGDMTAKALAIKLNQSINWSKTTTYTILSKLVNKGLIQRIGPNFTCHVILTKEEARKQEVDLLTKKLFDGSSDLLTASLLGGKQLTSDQIEKLRDMVQELAAENE